MAQEEDELLRSVALQNARSILHARQRAEEDLVQAKSALEARSEELARSLAMLRATLEAASDGILVTDVERRVTGYNQQYVEMWRLPAGALDSSDFRHPGDVCSQQFENPEQDLERLDEIYDSAPPESHDLLELVDGRVYERNSRIQYISGDNVGRVWSFRDVSERKRSELELRQQSEWLRITLSSIGDGVIAIDARGSVTFLNGVAEQLTGWSMTEAAGRPLQDIFQIVNEHTRLAVENPALHAMRDGVALGLANHSVLIARDGSERPIDDSAAPMRDHSGNMIGAVLVFRDVTERHRADAERDRLHHDLRDNEERLRLALEAGEMGAWDWDIQAGRITWSARVAEIYGMELEDFDGSLEMFARHTYPADNDRVMAAIQASLEKDVPYLIEFRIVQVNGTVRWIFTSGTVIHDSSGCPIRMIGATRDVSERKRVQLQLLEVARKKDEFLAVLAHELRNPLAPLRNGLEVMRLAAGDVRTVAEARAMMERQLGHMIRLVDDLLDLSRIGQNKMELRRALVRLKDVIDNAVETARPLIEAAEHQLTVSLPASTLLLDADLTRLAQVFSNLLTNSAKYTEHGGRIWLTGEQRCNEVIVSIRDTGIGIPKEALHGVFDMFSQVDRTNERATSGLGIGLALVKGLIEMHGGNVTAESEGYGQGCIFTVRLPIAEAVLDPQECAVNENDRIGAGLGRRILIVDDNEDAARSMAIVLELQGNEVRTAHDGSEAIGVVEEFQPHVILMDVGMPRMNGYEATRRIRKQPWGSTAVIVAVTGWGQEKDRAQSKQAGCDGHLVKPVDLLELEALVNELSATRHPATMQAGPSQS